MKTQYDKALEFNKEHESKTGSERRLEFLKLSPEEMFDYLDFIHQENIHG